MLAIHLYYLTTVFTTVFCIQRLILSIDW